MFLRIDLIDLIGPFWIWHPQSVQPRIGCLPMWFRPPAWWKELPCWPLRACPMSCWRRCRRQCLGGTTRKGNVPKNLQKMGESSSPRQNVYFNVFLAFATGGWGMFGQSIEIANPVVPCVACFCGISNENVGNKRGDYTNNSGGINQQKWNMMQPTLTIWGLSQKETG